MSAIALVVAAGLIVWAALALWLGATPGSPAVLLLGGLTAAAVVALLAGPAVRLRIAARAHRRERTGVAPFSSALLQILAGVVVAAIVVAFDWLLLHAVDPSAVDLRHFSLHPWVAGRLALLTGILASHVAALWAGTLILNASLAGWRPGTTTSTWQRGRVGALWVAPSVLVAVLAHLRGWPLPAFGIIASAVVCAFAALAARRVVPWFRHSTVAARMLGFFLAFLLPALLLYPSVDFYAERAMRSLIATRFAVQAQRQQQTLQDHLFEARREIDGIAGLLPGLVTEDQPGAPAAEPTPDSAFFVWKQTALARARLTSAVELYDRSGTLVSRFALNYPEYSAARHAPQAASGCDWDVFGEATPFGSEERTVLHADRQICVSANADAAPEPVGTIVVHVLLFDYRTLPFITSQNPYFEVFRPAEGAGPREGTTGSDVDVAIYGWGLSPIYTSGRVAWPLERRTVRADLRSLAPAVLGHGHAAADARYNVYFSNDRVFIYAIGYPSADAVRSSRPPRRADDAGPGAATCSCCSATAMFTRLARARPRLGRALLREIRASFYRKLFLAFVLASIIPVLTLAVVIRGYFANLLAADVALEAARTAAVAQRVIEESNALLQRTDGARPASDDVMVWISQVIDQDVNIFDGAKLVATSERDLFASGLLPTRTPDDVYRAIVLQRLPELRRRGPDRRRSPTCSRRRRCAPAGGRRS